MRQHRDSKPRGLTRTSNPRKKKSPKTTGTELPSLPTSVHNAIGPIPVEYVGDLRTSGDEKAMGLWLPEERRIQIRTGLPSVLTWLTIKHEWIHAVLWHAGVKLPEETEERICDTLAAALVAEMRG